MSEHVKEISSQDFKAEVVQSDLPVVVDFWAPWCGPCRVLAPILEDNLAKPLSGIVKFVKINIDDEPGLARLHGIQSIPTLILFRNGSEIDRGIGAGEGIKMIENFVNANYVKK